jgi:translation initiation factor IF-3
MTGAEYHEEEIKRREEKKAARQEKHIKPEKLLTLSNKISEHDLESKIAKCVKWIEKLHEVRVVITGDHSELQKTEKILATIETSVGVVNGRVLQKRIKDGVAKFSIMPTIKKESKETVEPQPKPAAPKKFLETERPVAEKQQVRSLHTLTISS